MPVYPDYEPAPPFAVWLREKRIARGWSQEDVARALGISLSSVTSWENARREPNYAMLYRLHVLFGGLPWDEGP